MAVDVGSAVGYLDLDISGFLAGLKTAQTEADTSSKNIAMRVGDNISGVGKKLTSVGSTLTKNVTVPLLGVGAAGIKVASDFEKGMSEVKAISGATGKQFEALREKAIELGASTAFSAGEVADAMTEMAKAGWSSEQIIDGMSGVLSAAAASGEGLAAVSTIVADAITGFGMEAKDSTKVADLLTQAANSGTIGINDLGESFKYMAPVAGAMGLSIEDVTTAISAMSMAGIKGSQAGTSLRTLLSNMVKPTDQMAIAMEKLGISAVDSQGNMKSLDDIVANLRDSFSGLTEAEKAKYAATIAGKEGMSGLLSLLNLTKEEYDAIGKSMDNSSGVAEETASVMQDNLQSKVEQLGGALESLAIKLADHVIPYVQQFVVWLTSLIDKFTSLDSETQKTILKFAAIAAAIGPATLAVGKLTTGVGGLVTAFGKAPGMIANIAGSLAKLTGVTATTATATTSTATLAAAFKTLGAVLSKIAWPIAIIVTVIGAFTTLWKTNEEFRNNIKAIWEDIKATFEKLTSGIVERLNKFGFDFENIGQVLAAIWKGFCDLLAPYFEAAFNFISIIFDFVVNRFLNTLDFFIALFTGDWEGCWEAVKASFENIWNLISRVFMNAINGILNIAKVVLGWFGIEWNVGMNDVGNTFKNIWQGIVDFFVMIWTNVRDFFVGLWQSIWAVVQPLFQEIVETFQMAWEVIKLVWGYVQPFFAAIWEGIKATFSVVAIWFKTIFEVAWENIKAAWSVVVSWFKHLWESIKAIFSVVATWFKGIFEVAWEAIKASWKSAVAFFTAIWAGIKAVFAVAKGVLSGNFTDAWNAIKNVWEKVKFFFSTVWDGIKKVFGSTVSFFKNTFSAAWEAVKKVFSSFGKFFSNLWDTIKDTFVNLGTKIGSAIGDAVKAGINGVIGMIEKTINGFIGLINGAIGAINAIPGVSIGKISTLSFPRLAKGGVVTRPTFAQIGEDGAEAVVPLEKNLGWIKALVKEFIERLGEFYYRQLNFGEKLDDIRKVCQEILILGRRFMSGDIGYTSYYGFGKVNNPNRQNPKSNRGSDDTGDTFYFYSPKPIDEIEAAKQMKKAKRELAEGF